MTDLASRPASTRAASRDRAAARRTALACMMTLAVAIGVGRFAFTPLLPLMLHAGALDLRHGGWLASLNYAGYFLGAVSCVALRLPPGRIVRAGLAATAVLTAAMGLAHQFPVWAVLRFLTGVVCAWTFVFASQWGLRRLAELGAPAWAGVIYTGPGVGIIVTGLLVSAAGRLGAAAGWIGFGLICLALAAYVWPVFAADRAGPREAVAARAAEAAGRGAPAAPAARSGRADAFWLTLLYGVPGFGYIITATFLPVIARHALPGSPWPDLFWPMFGIALIVGALGGGRLPLHWDNRLMLAGAYVLEAVGIVLGIVWPNAAGFAFGSILIGLPFTAITLFAMREARLLRGERAAALMGYATGAYGIGQIAGPLVATPLAASTGSFSPSLGLAAFALVAGAAGLVWRTRVSPRVPG